MLKMTIDGEEVVSKNNFTIKEEMLSPSSTILNNTYPKTWEDDKDYTSRFYYPKDYAKLDIQNFSITPEEAGTTIDIVGSATLNDVDTTKESRVLSLKGQTSQTGTPTPSSPIPINVVSGDNEINICGKNILDISTFVKGRINNTTGNLEYANNVSSMVIGENNISFVVSQAWNSGIASDFIPISTGNYVFKYSHNREITMCIDTYDNQKTRIARIDAFTQTQTPTTRTFTISDSNAKYIRIHFEVNTANVEYIVSEMQLEKNSTATTYEPYTGNTYPIYLGVENLLNEATMTSNANCTITDKVITTSSLSAWNIFSVNINNILLEKNTDYYATFKAKLNSGTGAINYGGNLSNGNTNGTQERISTSNVLSNEYQEFCWKITTTEDNFVGIRMLFQMGSNTTNAVVSIKDIIFSKKANAPYLPYGQAIELCKIGTYQDYIYKDNGSWYLHKEIGKVVLANTGYFASGGVSNIFYTTFITDYATNNNIPYSNQYTGVSNVSGASGMSSQANNTIGFINQSGSTTPRFYIKDTRFTSQVDLNNWIKDNPLEIYYVLATPTTTEITDTTLLEQLDALESQ